MQSRRMKKHLLFSASALAILLSLVGCVTSDVKPTNPAVVAKMGAINQRQMATVVIYRESNFYGVPCVQPLS